ncbi:MAG: helix-turn-helix transcriptional regulator [Promethearchaeota archaeon]
MNKLREVREREGLTLIELDRLSGVSEKTIRYIENGKKPGKRVTKQKIINGLNSNPRNKKKIKYEDIFNE